MENFLKLMVIAGISPIDALRSATSVPSECFSFLGDRGVIAPGKLADMVLVNGDPTVDILATRNIDSIWKSGTLVDRAATFATAEALGNAQ